MRRAPWGRTRTRGNGITRGFSHRRRRRAAGGELLLVGVPGIEHLVVDLGLFLRLDLRGVLLVVGAEALVPRLDVRLLLVEGVLRQEALLLELLAAHAVARPRSDLEALAVDLLAALLAPSELPAVDPAKRLLDEEELLAVQLGEREQELLGVGVHGVVDVVLGAVVEVAAAVALRHRVRLHQLALLLEE